MCSAPAYVRFGPKADSCSAKKIVIRTPRRRAPAKSVGCRYQAYVQVEGEFEFGRLQNGKIGGLSAFEDTAGIDADLAEDIGKAGSVAH